jgi:23S rRNA (pseudouridine1915-N3)-methyltransferase
MRIHIQAIGTKMPNWVEQGCQQYLKRMPREMQVTLTEFPLARRYKNSDLQKMIQQEGTQMLTQITSRNMVVAMEVKGKAWTTLELSRQLEQWRSSGSDIVVMIGGPDGLAGICQQRANVLWSLSPLTLPHPLVRIVLIEQLYRAWSILQGHPYHRE